MTVHIDHPQALGATRTLDPDALAAALAGGSEIAVVDVRPDPLTDGGHLLRAASIRLAELATAAPRLIPRRTCPVVVYGRDATDPDAEAAVAALTALGYTDIAVLDGGVAAWRAAGLPTYDRDLALTKAFGEFIEQSRRTPAITPRELRQRLDAGDDLVVVDARPFGEYHAATVPGAVNVPGAELLRRIDAVVSTRETTVVITCGGRTRAIIGAQVLIDAGIDNPVLELVNGTTGWALEGLPLETNADRVAGEPAPDTRQRAAARAAHLARRAGVREIDAATLAYWQLEAPARTLYTFDVRTAEEYEAGHLAGTVWVPGGQLVQELSRHVAVLGARVVLVDDPDGIRARATGAWLRQLGLPDVAVLAGWPEDATETAHGLAVRARLERGNAITPDSDLAARRTSSSAYVAWCANVVSAVAADPTHRFRELAR